MNQVPDLEVIDLGEAKELTKGWPLQPKVEDHPVFNTRPM